MFPLIFNMMFHNTSIKYVFTFIIFKIVFARFSLVYICAIWFKLPAMVTLCFFWWHFCMVEILWWNLLPYSSLMSPDYVERSLNENGRNVFSLLCCTVTFLCLKHLLKHLCVTRYCVMAHRVVFHQFECFSTVYFQVLLGLHQNSRRSWHTLCVGQRRSCPLSLCLWSMETSIADTRNSLHSIVWSTQDFSSVQAWCKVHCESTFGPFTMLFCLNRSHVVAA